MNELQRSKSYKCDSLLFSPRFHLTPITCQCNVDLHSPAVVKQVFSRCAAAGASSTVTRHSPPAFPSRTAAHTLYDAGTDAASHARGGGHANEDRAPVRWSCSIIGGWFVPEFLLLLPTVHSFSVALPLASPSSTPPHPILRSHSFNSKPTSASAPSHFPAPDAPSMFDPVTAICTADLSPVHALPTTAPVPPTTAPVPPTTRQPRLASPRTIVFSGPRDAAVAAAPVFVASQPSAFFAAASEQVCASASSHTAQNNTDAFRQAADVVHTAVFDKMAVHYPAAFQKLKLNAVCLICPQAPSRRVGKDLQRIPSSTRLCPSLKNATVFLFTFVLQCLRRRVCPCLRTSRLA